MKVQVSYDKFNVGIEKAVIPVGTDESFEISLVEDSLNPSSQLIEIKTVDALANNEVSLQMTLEEAKQFNLLMSQFLRQL